MKRLEVVYITNNLPGRPFTDKVAVPDNYTDADIKEALEATFDAEDIRVNGQPITVHHITLVKEE